LWFKEEPALALDPGKEEVFNRLGNVALDILVKSGGTGRHLLAAVPAKQHLFAGFVGAFHQHDHGPFALQTLPQGFKLSHRGLVLSHCVHESPLGTERLGHLRGAYFANNLLESVYQSNAVFRLYQT